jgi:Arc/MetJ family transcription regulator
MPPALPIPYRGKTPVKTGCAQVCGFDFVSAIAGSCASRALDAGGQLRHTIHMKRTNLVLDAQLLEETLRVSGERTYSRAVERAMAEFVRRSKARGILDLAGTGAWEGDLAVVREDNATYGKGRGRGPR